ncbi:Gmad2 immunoglobulin-like domain-containing protein [Petroclostridium sp. X23]|uniref:Gmad2 immunoglobulin-like domain-containing protein n=1 Tax=Petroclostridium sp. X23 TaxID=3045146 RepID=UPI0024AD3CAC|nr:Gmad2 immunoglobulin-like domain-containing protein [Petroclostridium sp. X23]WHH57446.1 Gmad2 immunoglobulin-like domain-containing protein [Petroclostridium sp. X23]
MKRLCMIMFIIFILLTGMACSKQQGAAPDGKDNPPPASNPPAAADKPETKEEPKVPEEKKEGPYADLIVEKAPQEVMDWFDSFGTDRGAYVYQHPDNTYIKINAGEKPTGGYGIEIKDFIDNEYEKKIVAEVTEPQKGEMVTQAITYPSIILRFKDDQIAQYVIEDKKGNTFPLESKVFLAAFEMPREGEKIDNPVRVKGMVAAFEGSFAVRILDADGNILKEENLQTTGAPYWGSFDEEIAYPSPAAAKGSIEVGEFSAKDGQYISHAEINVEFGK